MKHSPSITIPFDFQGEKRLRSKDRAWIVTDVQGYTSSLYPWSVPQQWYKAGALCLDTKHLAIVEFSLDDVRAFLRAGLAPAPWKSPQAFGLELTRIYHGPKKEGRFRETVALIDIDPELVIHGPMLRKHFEREMGLRGNSTPGMWQELVDRANLENSIEAAALSFNEWFSAGMVKDIVGQDINVSPSLKRMVKDGLLITNGKTRRATKYMKAPPPCLVERADWVG